MSINKNDTQDDNTGTQSKERYREKRKKRKDQLQVVIQDFDHDEWDDWMDDELFDTFEPIPKSKRKR